MNVKGILEMEEIKKAAEADALANYNEGIDVPEDFHRSVMHNFYDTEAEVECYIRSYHAKKHELLNKSNS